MTKIRIGIAAAMALACAAPALGEALGAASAISAGRKLYLEGEDGTPLIARRAGGLAISGPEAACVSCHRRSGLGGSEGRSYIPPINAASLFAANAPGTGASASGTGRPAYGEEALARAIRSGIDPAGRRLDYLMPRYDMSAAQMSALIAYLRQLPSQRLPGVADNAVDFATVIAPGVEPTRSKAMVQVLDACFEEHNAGPRPAPGRKRLAPDMNLGEQRKWRLHLWQLEGKPETWAAQLSGHARRNPAFAMVGGIGAGDWAPVHQFCESDGMPCLFPRVEVPITAETGFYTMYLSRGLLLEAGILARRLGEQSDGVKRAIQVLRAEDAAARAAAQALGRRLAARGIESEERAIEADGPLAARTFDSGPADALVLWLRADDLQRLEAVEPVSAPAYVSGMLGGGEQAPLPAAWKARALMAYPYELPQNRASRMAQLHAWLRAHGLAPADETVQADALIACSALGAAMNEVAGHLSRDYLVERLEAIVGRGGFPGHYPNLSLGAGQRFSSKSGYLVRFSDPKSTRIEALGERVAP